jgi:hypothetical protein
VYVRLSRECCISWRGVVPFVSIICGLLLILLGWDGYADTIGLIRPTELHSPTALIPAYFGAALILCGIVALKESLLKHAMHVAAMVGLIGLLAGAGMGLPKLPKLLAGEAERPAAVKLQLWMAGVCLVLVALCVNSFIQARRRRKSAVG